MDDAERGFLERARRGVLATADGEGRPAAVPVCFALVGDAVVTPIDEKPKVADPGDLRRVRDVRANPRVTLVVDRYDEDWTELAWVQVRGTARVVEPGNGGGEAVDDVEPVDHDGANGDDGAGGDDEANGDDGTADHGDAVAALRAKYDQYADHALEERPLLRVVPGHVVSWTAGDSL